MQTSLKEGWMHAHRQKGQTKMKPFRSFPLTTCGKPLRPSQKDTSEKICRPARASDLNVLIFSRATVVLYFRPASQVVAGRI